MVDPEWSHHWRWGGPMLLALGPLGWSHVAGGRHLAGNRQSAGQAREVRRRGYINGLRAGRPPCYGDEDLTAPTSLTQLQRHAER